MNKTYKFPALWMMCLMLFSCLTFTACDNGDDEDTNQYKGGINLNVFGPSPVARGGVLRFLGSGMDKVTAVAIPGCDDITDIEVVSDTEIRVTVPQTAQPGLVVLKTPKGDITTKTELTFTLRSIDLGAMEVVSTYEELQDYRKVGSPFSIPKAALVLAGFHPDFSTERFASLEAQLKAFGTGIEVTLLSAIPAGSGLGTSSILAATVLGALNDFCGLNWDKQGIGSRTLVLEQLLTTGGGWQDQYGGVLHGVKLLQTQPGWHQEPKVRWLPDYLFTSDEYRKCHLLYYTGITRTAKGILAEIVKGMFLNSNRHLHLLEQMKGHAMDMYDAILRNDFEETGRLIRKTWKQNQLLDEGTNPATVQALTERIDDLCLGYKLPGAGGGGYLYMVAKDPDAAVRIRRILTEERPNERARFVEMSLSNKGLEISRS